MTALSNRPLRHGSASPLWQQLDEALRHCAGDGMTASEAAAALGITKNAAIGRAIRAGVTWARGWKPKRKRRTWDFPSLGHCIFPHGHVGEPGFEFCGERTVTDTAPYCVAHAKLCWTRRDHGND